jgi:Abnormal spindle-like microcephaly-assoc'd, ASPM-SPD-2-Hydin
MIVAASKELRFATIFIGLVLVALLPAPDRASAEIGPEDTPPIISNGVVSPSGLPYTGGQVTIDADIEDDFGVFMAYAQIYGTNGIVESVLLIPSKISETGVATYSGSFNVPPNFTDSPVNYGVEIQASDTNGGTAAELIGDVEVEAQPQFDEAPYVTNPVVEPRELLASGGAVTIRAGANDNRGISEVYATVTMPDGSTAAVPMEPFSCCDFEGTLTVPPNTGATPQQYSIEIVALDDIGQPGTADAGLITVAPPSPPAGALAVEPDSFSFGSVKLGQQAGQSLLVENVGPQSSAPIEGTLTSSGDAFSPARVDGVSFRLKPGQSKRYRIVFRPSSLGPQNGSVTISSSNEAEPDIVVPLSGQGVARR